VLLVEEAGGKVTDLDGGPFDLRSGRIIATNGRIHDELRNVISEYYKTRGRADL
jgi:myo-inositol-1(or 4)-monophosphatase